MITFVLSPSVLGHTRFAFSPLTEVTMSLRLLGLPHPAHIHAPWLRHARTRVGEVDMELLMGFAPAGRWLASFLAPHSDGPQTTIEQQLSTLSTLAPTELERGAQEMWEGRSVPRRVQQLLSDGPQGPSQLAEALWDYWDAAIAPFWPRMCAVLEDDVSHRVATLLNSGLFALLDGLHAEISTGDDRLYVDKPHHAAEEYQADRMTLVPSVFTWPGLLLDDGTANEFGVTYAARGVGRVWEGLGELEATPDNRLAALLGRTRAAILERAAVPMSTTQIARELGQSPGSVNQHLTVLRDTGLLTSWRSGRSVLYRQTSLAQTMLEAQAAVSAASRSAGGSRGRGA